jgi:hypothetical protein
MLFMGKKFPGEKGSETVSCDARASSFVAEIRGEAFAQFHAVAVERHTVSCGTDCLACQDDFIYDVKENYEHALDFALHLSRLLRHR